MRNELFMIEGQREEGDWAGKQNKTDKDSRDEKQKESGAKGVWLK